MDPSTGTTYLYNIGNTNVTRQHAKIVNNRNARCNQRSTYNAMLSTADVATPNNTSADVAQEINACKSGTPIRLLP